MPIYLYRNLTTNDTFELEQRITESALSEHPETGDPVKRLIQPVGISFKGSGFYVNDSRASSTKPAKTEAKTDGTAAKTDSSGSPAKTGDAKGEGKSDAKTGDGKKSDSQPAKTGSNSPT